jgi:hypothetical protein
MSRACCCTRANVIFVQSWPINPKLHRPRFQCAIRAAGYSRSRLPAPHSRGKLHLRKEEPPERFLVQARPVYQAAIAALWRGQR